MDGRAELGRLRRLISPSHFDHAAYAERMEAMPPRMRAVIERVCMGQPLPSIAAEMAISIETVRKHIRAGIERCGVRGGQRRLVAWLLLGVRCA